MTDISTACNSITAPTNINANSPRECYIDDGNDLVIWTYHFTTFAAYTPSSTSSAGGGGGINVPRSDIHGKINTQANLEKNSEKNANTPLIEATPNTNNPKSTNFFTGAITGLLGNSSGRLLVTIFVIAVFGIAITIMVRRFKKNAASSK